MTRRKHLLNRFSILSKLIVMLVLCAMLSTAIVTAIAFQTGRNNLRGGAFTRLTEIRETQARAITSQIDDLTNALISYTHGGHTISALQDFSAAFDQLNDSTITPAQSQDIARYYHDVFVPLTEKNSGERLDAAALLPTSDAQRYLQAFYTSKRKDDETALTMNDARDGSAWSRANAKYQDFFREIVSRFDFEDALLIDGSGNIVYSAFKDVDLGTNILDGPYRGSKLRSAYNEAMASNVGDKVVFTDFELYEPAEMSPTAWMVAKLPATGKPDGVLALQFPIAKINRLMTFDRRWSEVGMGRTGETVLGGPDLLMRSDSRLFLEDPDEYKRAVIAAGTAPDIADIAIRQGGTTLVQPLKEDGQLRAERGESGTLIGTDYLGRESLQAYAPIVGKDWNLHWTIVAKISRAEAFAVATTFARKVVLTSAAIIFAVCLLSALLAHAFVRPIRRLESGYRRVGSGDFSVKLPVETNDEIGDLTQAFNEMSSALHEKEEVIQRQRAHSRKVLAGLMPTPIAEQVGAGETISAADHRDVSVVVIRIDGLSALEKSLDADALLDQYNELVRQFDAAAQDYGLDPIRALRNGYLAAGGLTVPQLDGVRKATEFARRCVQIVERFNATTDNPAPADRLSLRIGIDSGRVSSGMVGEVPAVIFHIWGPAVDGAERTSSSATEPGIYLTAGVRDVLSESLLITMVSEAGDPIWRLDDESS